MCFSMGPLPTEFYERDPEIVSKGLLGKGVVRRLGAEVLDGMIVETEAYYGQEDPASRAYHGLKIFNRNMWGTPGTLFIYNVHKYWMLNIVAHKPNRVGAVLIRSIEPTNGLQIMKRNRGISELSDLTTGPGKLTQALRIDKRLNGAPVTSKDGEVCILDSLPISEVGSSHRIGVKKDLKRNLRFFIKGNRFLSK